MSSGKAPSLDVLARHLEVLASPTRLELLHALRAPRIMQEIRVLPSLTRAGERPERPLTRQAVSHHLDQLVEAGLVQRLPREGRGDAFVLDHMRLFALVDEIRGLARLRPAIAAGSGGTMDGDARTLPPMPDPPRLVVAFGRDDGVAFSLAEGGPWRVGRAPACEVCLDYDPYLSSEHARIVREGDGFLVEDLGSRNGTLVNWRRLEKGETRALHMGDLLGVGRSVLVVQTS